MPVGIRRHYCPSHQGYRGLCAEIAGRLAEEIGVSPAIVGWQVDNEIAGDGFTCWCSVCGQAFHDWLRERYGSLEQLNHAWQTGIWSQVYTSWGQIPVPVKSFWNHAPALKMAYRRFRSDNWLKFYQRQRQSLRQAGARGVTTNFYNLSWDMPFDQWQWRDHLDALGESHYLEDETASHFQLAVLQGADPGVKPLWILEQKAGQQAAQNLYPDDPAGLARHLRICAEAGAEFAIYWHLRQHTAGCEMEHVAILAHDGQPGRIAKAIKQAIVVTSDLTRVEYPRENILIFSFQQQWSAESRPQSGTAWNYRTEVEQRWYGAAVDVLGGIRVGDWRAIDRGHRLVVAPFLQMEEEGIAERLLDFANSGGILITTADLGRADAENNLCRRAVLGVFAAHMASLRLEMLQLTPEASIEGTIEGTQAKARLFLAVPESELPGIERIGELKSASVKTALALRIRIGQGSCVVALTAPERVGVAALLRYVMAGRASKEHA